MSTIEYKVTGMTCGHCESSIKAEVGQIAGIQSIAVSAKTGKLLVTSHTGLDDAAVLGAVEEAGYEAVRVP